LYAYKVDCLRELEKLSRERIIDLFYGDESHVCSEGYVPYGWQFPDEDVFIASSKGFRLNCFAMLGRSNECHWVTTTQSIDANFIVEQLERLSFKINKPTFLVLDCARIHTGKKVQERVKYWQQRGLYLLYLPPYSPHLNLAETLWRKLKTEWLAVEDYLQEQALFYATNRCLASVGTHLKINFSEFALN
jgi:transposase